MWPPGLSPPVQVVSIFIVLTLSSLTSVPSSCQLIISFHISFMIILNLISHIRLIINDAHTHRDVYIFKSLLCSDTNIWLLKCCLPKRNDMIKCSTGISNGKCNWPAVLRITMSKVEFKFKQSEPQIQWSIKPFVTPVISHPFFSCTFPRKGSRVVLSVTWASSDENANRKPQTKSSFLFSITVARRFRFSPTAVSV